MSLIAKLSGMQETPELSRRELLFGIGKDILEDMGLLYLLKSSPALADEEKELNVNSIQSLKELDELITEFNEYYLDNSEYGKQLKTLFLQAPEPTIKKFEGYAKIKIRDGKMLVPKSQNDLSGAVFENFNDTITVNGISPRLKIDYLLEGIPLIQLSRLHETVHFFQDDNSNYDGLFDIEKKHGIWGHYIKDLDSVVFLPSNQEDLDISQPFTRYSNPKVAYLKQLPWKQLRPFFNELINTEPWKSHYLKGELGSVEQKMYDFFKKYQENEINRSIIFEAQAYFVAAPENILKTKIKAEDIAEWMITYADLGNQDQVRNAVDSIAKAYASLLNSNIPETEKHKIVAGIVGRNQFTYDPKSGRYEGVEKEIAALEKKHGKGSISKLNEAREKQVKDLADETLKLFHKFLRMKGYTSITFLETEVYGD